jgi:hypothetical protein
MIVLLFNWQLVIDSWFLIRFKKKYPIFGDTLKGLNMLITTFRLMLDHLQLYYNYVQESWCWILRSRKDMEMGCRIRKGMQIVHSYVV